MNAGHRTSGPSLERPKVVYVMGSARSGSTILGVTLGNCEGVFYAGELGGWLVKSGVPTLAGAERARFWSIVRKDVDGAADLFGDEAQRCIERSAALFRVYKWPARRRLRRRYRRVTEELYGAIARAAEVTHVVDTSSYPLRAHELQRLNGIDLYLVYMVRNPHSVIASFTRSDWRFSGSTVVTNLYLWLTNLLSVCVFLRHRRDRRMFLRNEDFIADPEGVLRAVLDCCESSAALPELTSLRTGIAFQGNRLLRSGEVIALRNAIDAPLQRSRITTLLQLPWAAVFSRLQPAAAASTRHHRATPHEDVAAR